MSGFARKYKKRTFKRRSSRKGYTKQYRRKAVARRRFPTSRPTSRIVRPPMYNPDRELVKMKTRYTGTLTPLSLAGADPMVNTNIVCRFSMNDIRTPTSISGGLVSPAATAPNGYTLMGLQYNAWQVRGARITIRVTQFNTAGTGTVVPATFCIVPMGEYMSAAAGSASPFNAMIRTPGHSRLFRTMQTGNGGDDITLTATGSAFSSPQKAEASPGYLTDIAASSGTFVSAGVPSRSPCFALLGSWVQALIAGTTFTLDIDFEWSVLWWDRLLPTLSIEEKGPVASSEDMDEAAFDRLSFLEEKKESKEEKKDPPPPASLFSRLTGL